jgi:hypothetical protein
LDRRRFSGASAAARMRRAVVAAARLDMSVDATCASDAASGGTAVAAEMPAADAGSEKSTPCYNHHQLDTLFVMVSSILASLLHSPSLSPRQYPNRRYAFRVCGSEPNLHVPARRGPCVAWAWRAW